jgi:DNA mismatch endonuclease (patch repair protein)
MSDVFDKKTRSKIMSRIGGKNTAPERAIAGLLRKNKIRFRRHVKSLPGTPDFVLSQLKTVVFVHGCFWHGHSKCRRAERPATNKEFWNNKIDLNIRRDKIVRRKLRGAGWKVLVIWQCKVSRYVFPKGFLKTNLKKGHSVKRSDSFGKTKVSD